MIVEEYDTEGNLISVTELLDDPETVEADKLRETIDKTLEKTTWTTTETRELLRAIARTLRKHLI